MVSCDKGSILISISKKYLRDFTHGQRDAWVRAFPWSDGRLGRMFIELTNHWYENSVYGGVGKTGYADGMDSTMTEMLELGAGW